MESAYQRGDSVSTYSLERGAVADDVRYTPRMSSAWRNYQDMHNLNKPRKGALPFVQEIDLGQGQGSWLQSLRRLTGQKLNQCNKKHLLSSFSGNSIVSLTDFVTGVLFALAVSKKGRFHPGGRKPLSWPWIIMLGSTCFCTTSSKEVVPPDIFPVIIRDRLWGA